MRERGGAGAREREREGVWAREGVQVGEREGVQVGERERWRRVGMREWCRWEREGCRWKRERGRREGCGRDMRVQVGGGGV